MLTSAAPLRAFTLALIQLGSIGSNKSDNLRHAQQMILRASHGQGSAKKPDLIVLPECFNSPYGHTHFPKYAEVIGFTPGKPYDASRSGSETVRMLSSIARQVQSWIIGGELVAMHRKVHLFDIDIPGKIKFKESETLTGGTTLNSFDAEFGRIGLGICYDIRFPEMAMISARQGCQVLIYPGAFNMTTGPLHWELLQRSRAVDNHVFMAMCSPARDLSAGYHAWGHSMVVDPMGRVLCEAAEGEEIIYVDIGKEYIYE
ncbi:hypothetical protein D9613_002815 [Agrocybe pediades]|uniref:CN hydrolase domain-containing protein n=1 Tax=Agrocybe pediades TaxID=84607 RepID=A0A8H4VL04_9AGAR|nr:hypothetical protein D9613_002815 [Agrocybe pediades]